MSMNYNDLVLFSLLFFAAIKSLKGIQPHIILVAVDNLGFNDLGFHGHSIIPTPNIDALAYSGVILNNYYVYPFSNQSISALMRGRYPSQTQLPFTEYTPLQGKILPDYLSELGYTNRILGKWEFETWDPENHGDYSTDTYPGRHPKTFLGKLSINNPYTRDAFKQAVEIILHHDTSTPLFLYIGHDTQHLLDYISADAAEEFKYIKNNNTRKYAVKLNKLDQSMGELFHALKLRKMSNRNSIIIFTSTNGGESGVLQNPLRRNGKHDLDGWTAEQLQEMMHKKNLNLSSNYPLRGGKGVVFEGGIRGTAFLWSNLVAKPSRISNGMMQIVDWLPTLLDATCGDSRTTNLPYAVSMWKTIFFGTDSSRFEMLHMLDTVNDVAALTLGKWKLITGDEGKLGLWTENNVSVSKYNFDLVFNSPTGQTLGYKPISAMKELKEAATIYCTQNQQSVSNKCEPMNAPCLFNIRDDPCEYENLADKYPEVVSQLLKRIEWHSEFTIRDQNDVVIIPEDIPETVWGPPIDQTETDYEDISIWDIWSIVWKILLIAVMDVRQLLLPFYFLKYIVFSFYNILYFLFCYVRSLYFFFVRTN